TTRGTDDFKVGNELQIGLSSGYIPANWLTLSMQLNFAAHGSEQSADPDEHAHSGSQATFLTPGVSLRLAEGLSSYGLFQTRLAGQSDSQTVVAQNHWMFGTTYTLGR